MTGKDLRRERRLRDVRQADVAAAMGIGQQQIARIEAMPQPSEQVQVRYLKALDKVCPPERVA